MEEGEEEVGKVLDEFKELKRKYKILREAAKVFRVEDEDLPRVLDRFKNELEEMKKRSTNVS